MRLRLSLLIPWLVVLLVGVNWSTPSARAQGRLLQTLEAFYTPAAAVVAPDGRTVFVTNGARGDTGMYAGRGSVSRAKADDTGQLKVTQARLSDGLNAPLGITQLRGACGVFPAGSLVVAVGGRWTVDARGERIADPRERGTGFVFIDPETGEKLGAVYLGAGSPVEAEIGHGILDPGPIVSDAQGNIYLGDIAGMGVRREDQEANVPGILKVTPDGVAALIAGTKMPPGSARFISVPEVPAGLLLSSRDESLYVATGSGAGDLSGALLRIPGGTFGEGARIDTLAKEISPIVGMCETPNGNYIVSRFAGDIAFIKRGSKRHKVVKFNPKLVLLSPGQPACIQTTDGGIVVIQPDMAQSGRGPWQQRVLVFSLPKEY